MSPGKSGLLRWWFGITIGWNLAIAWVAVAAPDSPLKPNIPLFTHLTQLRDFAQSDSNRICSFRLTGVLCAVDPSRSRLSLKDDSGLEVLQLALPKLALQPGDQVTLEGICFSVWATEQGLALGTGPVVNNDGLHPLDEKSGAVHLSAGLNPIQVRWFNHLGQYSLTVEYEGPDLARQQIPDSALFRKTSAAANPISTTNGLRYTVYQGVWHSLPDFTSQVPTAVGTALNFDLGPKTRNEEVGMQFDGLLSVPREGVYRFYLKSDDGSDLSVGEPQLARVEVLGPAKPVQHHSISEGRFPANPDHSFWAELEGEVTFVAEQGSRTDLEVRTGNERVRLILLDSTGLPAWRLRKSHIRAQGICRTAQSEDGRKVPGVLLTLNASNLQVIGTTNPPAPHPKRWNPLHQKPTRFPVRAKFSPASKKCVDSAANRRTAVTRLRCAAS